MRDAAWARWAVTSRYAQSLERQRQYARWLATPAGVRAFFEQGPDQELMRQFYRHARLTLAAADPYHWVPEMCDLLDSISAAMPPWTLRREALPTDYGFCWFESPLPVDGGALRVVALAWGLSVPAAHSADDVETLVINVYGGADHEHSIWPLLSLSWPTGDLLGAEDLDSDADTAQNTRMQRRIFRYASAIFALLEQRILVATPEAIDRAARRRLQKAKARQPPSVLVIRLRRAAREADDHDGQARPWTCRWIVRGHWRQQYYPSSGEYRPIFILPHIKGPDDMPLRDPAERVFAVVR